MMAEGHRLGDLQMGEAGHHGVGVLFGQIEQGRLQALDQGQQFVDGGAQPQAHVGGDLVVARAAGVQPLAGVADQGGEAFFDVQVDVFQVERPFELAGADFVQDLRQARCGSPPGRPRR